VEKPKATGLTTIRRAPPLQALADPWDAREGEMVEQLTRVWLDNIANPEATTLGDDLKELLAPPAVPVPGEDVANYCEKARATLSRPAHRDQIADVVVILTTKIQQSTRIPDMVEHGVDLAWTIAKNRFSGPVIHCAALEAQEKYNWTPQVADFVADCRAVRDRLEGGLLMLEEPGAGSVRYNARFVGMSAASALAALRKARRERLYHEAEMGRGIAEEQARPAIDPALRAWMRADYRRRDREMEERHALWIETPEGRRQEERERAMDEERRARSRPVYRY
jgi:hypothetical protein